MAHNEAHNALVKDALEQLALSGYTAWSNQTGVWFEYTIEHGKLKKGRPHKYGKTGSGDIIIVLPMIVMTASGLKRTIGWHVEAEAKTGLGRQGENQSLHQEFCVERNGGAYILFRDVPFLLAELAHLKSI